VRKKTRGGCYAKPKYFLSWPKAKKIFCHRSTEKNACFLIHFQNTKNEGSSKGGTVTIF